MIYNWFHVNLTSAIIHYFMHKIETIYGVNYASREEKKVLIAKWSLLLSVIRVFTRCFCEEIFDPTDGVSYGT